MKSERGEANYFSTVVFIFIAVILLAFNLNDIFFAPAANQDLTYDQVLEDVQRYFAENHASTIAEAGEGNAERATTLLKELMVQYIVKRKYAIEGLTTEELCEKLYEDISGASAAGKLHSGFPLHRLQRVAQATKFP